MEYMRKIEVAPGQFILYNGTFFVKQCDEHIVWTSSRPDACIYSSAEADVVLEKNYRFMRAGS